MTMVKINPEKLRFILETYKKANHTTLSEMSTSLGRCDSYLNNVLHKGVCSSATMKMLNLLYGFRPEDYVWTVDDEAEEVEESTDEWTVEWKVEPEKSRALCRVRCGEEDIAYGYAKVKDPTSRLSIMQAISYAAHICYKKVEQMDLEAL